MKTFKRALSSILAFAMVLTTLTVMNATNTFANTYTWDAPTSGTVAAKAALINNEDVVINNVYSITASENTDSSFGTDTYSGKLTFRGNSAISAHVSDPYANDSPLYYNNATSIVVDANTDGTFKAYIGINRGKHVYVWDNTDNKQIKDETSTNKAVMTLTQDMTAGHQYIVYTRGTTAALLKLEYVTASVTPSIALNENALTVALGSTASLTATTNNMSGDEVITWTSDNTNIATVNDGIITPVAVGTANITASTTYNNVEYSASCAVTVVNTYTKTINVTPNSATVSTDNGTLAGSNGSYTITLEKGATANIKASSDDYISSSVTVNEDSDDTIEIALTAIVGINGSPDTNRLSLESFNSSSKAEDISLKNKYTVNGYTLNAGNIILQNAQTPPRIRLSKNDTVTYTPEADGKITVNGQPANTSATDRGFSVTSSAASETIAISSSDGTTTGNDSIYFPKGSGYDDYSFDVKAGNTYTIKSLNGINVQSISFSLSAGLTKIQEGVTDSTVEVYKDGTYYYVISKVSNEYVAESGTTLIGQALNANADPYATTQYVYNGVKLTDDTTIMAEDGTYLWGVKIEGATEENETLIKAIVTVLVNAQ